MEEMNDMIMKDNQFLSGADPQPKVFKVKGYTSRIMSDRSMYYASCPECKKKVTPNDQGIGYYCERCQKAHAECKFQYNFSMRIEDFTSQIYSQILGESPGEHIMGMTANDFKQLQNL